MHVSAVQVSAGQCRKGQVSAGQCRSVQVSAGQCRKGQVSAGQCRSVQERAGQGRSVQVSAGQCRKGQVRACQCKSVQVTGIKHIAPSRLPGFRHANTSVSVVPAPGSPGLNYSFMWIVNPMHWRYGYQFVEFVSYRIYKF